MKKKNFFADVLQSVTKYFLILVLLVIAGIALSGIRVVDSGNVAVILRFGKLVGDTPEEQIHEPGLLLAFPYIIDEVVTVPTGSIIEQTVTTYHTPENIKTRNGSYLITGDQNVAVLSASVKYTISDPVAYALNVADIPAIVNAAVSNAMLTNAASSEVDALITSGKDRFIQDSLRLASKKLELAQVGISLNTLELTQISVPKEVREVYEEVNSASVEAATILENAALYKDTLLPKARATAASYETTANNNYATKVAAANTALAEFWGVIQEYEQNPQAVAVRLLNEKTKTAMSKIGTVRVVQDGESTILLLPKVEESDGES